MSSLYTVFSEGVWQVIVRHLRSLLMRIFAPQAEIRNLRLRVRELEDLVTRDSLTGALNRRGMDEVLRREVPRATRKGGLLSCILLDLDHFKRVNDTYGHPFGDKVLRTVIEVILAIVRPSDYVVRFGGEEFVILLPDTSVNQGMALAERIRLEVRGKGMQTSTGEEFYITVSAGVGQILLDDTSASWTESIELIDRALYRAKRDGRDCVRLSSE